MPIALASTDLALEGHGRVARDDESAADARETGGQFVGQGVDEVVLPRIARQIGEGQHDDRKPRGLGGRLRSDACGPVRIEEPPRAARDHDEQRRERGGERREPETPLRRRGRRGRDGFRRLRLRGDADLKRIDPDRLGDVLELGRAEIGDREIEPPLDLTIGVLGQTDRAGLADALQSRGDIDAVAHQIAVALLDDVAEMNADAELDAALGRQAGVALDQAVLHFDRAAHRVDHAAKLDEAAVAGALDDPPVMRGDGGVDQVAAEPPKARERAILVRSREPAIADDIGDQDRRNFPGLAHSSGSPALRRPSKIGSSWAQNVGSSDRAAKLACIREMTKAGSSARPVLRAERASSNRPSCARAAANAKCGCE